MGWKDTLVEFDAAIKAEELDKADNLLKRAELEKRAESMAEVKTAADPAARPQFGATEEDAPAESYAVKSWYIKKYGDTGAAMDQVMGELYGANHKELAWAKTADFLRYIRTGQADPKLHRAVVYSPAQVAQALADGLSVGELKATQVESQDTLGGLAKAA